MTAEHPPWCPGPVDLLASTTIGAQILPDADWRVVKFWLDERRTGTGPDEASRCGDLVAAITELLNEEGRS